MMKVPVGVVGFDEALKIVLDHATGLAGGASEVVGLLACGGRVLAEGVKADRDQPPFDRSTRDGFAVRAIDVVSGSLKVVGQIKAGERWQGWCVGPHCCNRDYDWSADTRGCRCRRDGRTCGARWGTRFVWALGGRFGVGRMWFRRVARPEWGRRCWRWAR